MVVAVELAVLSGAFGMAVGQVHFYFLRKRERILRRAERLTHAAQNLDVHVEAFGKFVDDVAAPDQLKAVLVHFGDAISNHDTANQCVQVLVSNKHVVLSDDARMLMDSLEELRQHRPDLAQAFIASVMSGLLYMLLRWPETAQVFEEAASRIATDPARGVGFAAKAARLRANGSLMPESEFGSVPALVGA